MPRKKAPVEPKPKPVKLELPTLTCCLCGATFVGWGNNPSPLSDNPDDRCCDDCNYTKVIPARLAEIAEKFGKE